MPVKVGNSYVSEAAYEFAKNQTDENATLKSLAEKFPNLKFSVGSAPFSGNGLNNVAISPNIFREMEQNPEKKLEYEALLYDVANLNQPRADVKAQGVIIDKNGGLSMWSISENKREKISVKRDETKNWWQKLLEKIKNPKKNDEISGKVAFNAEKRARQLAAADSKSKVREILQLLQKDLDECKAGFEKNWCDKDEIKKVEAMIEAAEKRLNEVDEVSDEKFSVDVLI